MAGMGVVVARICVGAGRVGGRNGVSVAWGAQAAANIKVRNHAIKPGRIIPKKQRNGVSGCRRRDRMRSMA